MKDVNEADVTNALPLLKQFLDAKPAGKFAWIADLKPVAQRYLHDCELYAAWKTERAGASDAAALSASLEKLREVEKELKPYRAIFYEAKAEEKRLSQQIADLQGAEETTQKKQEQQVAQEFAQKKPQWMRDWKNKLIADLTHARFSGTISDTSGVKYTGILAATQQSLTMQLPYGTAQLPWAKIAPQTLLAISVSFAKPNASDVADRQWLCAIYASETGQIEEARKLAEEAAKAKPEYRKQMSLLVK